MSVIFQDFLRQPGMEAVLATAEANILWNKGQLAVFDFGSIISGTATDAGNTPTSTLRTGLLLGKKTSDGKLYAWSATATDGTQVVYGVLPFDVNLLDPNAAGQDRFLAVLIGGWVKNAAIVAAAGALDAQARQQMRGRFFFDDDFGSPAPGSYYPFRQQLSKTTNYACVAADNGTLFDNNGAVGSVTFTLPPIADGLMLGFACIANQTITITSNEGTNIVAPNNASATSLAFSTGGDKIGALVRLFTNPGGTKWMVSKECSSAMTIS